VGLRANLGQRRSGANDDRAVVTVEGIDLALVDVSVVRSENHGSPHGQNAQRLVIGTAVALVADLLAAAIETRKVVIDLGMVVGRRSG
jgi:hypothetical protein